MNLKEYYKQLLNSLLEASDTQFIYKPQVEAPKWNGVRGGMIDNPLPQGPLKDKLGNEIKIDYPRLLRDKRKEVQSRTPTAPASSSSNQYENPNKNVSDGTFHGLREETAIQVARRGIAAKK